MIYRNAGRRRECSPRHLRHAFQPGQVLLVEDRRRAARVEQEAIDQILAAYLHGPLFAAGAHNPLQLVGCSRLRETVGVCEETKHRPQPFFCLKLRRTSAGENRVEFELTLASAGPRDLLGLTLCGSGEIYSLTVD